MEQIDCKLFQEMIFPYLDNNLTDEATACFLEHARSCPECQAALEEARSFEFGLIGSFVHMDPPADFADKVMADLHKAPIVEIAAATAVNKKSKNSKKKFFGAVGTVAAAAALVLAVNFASGTPDNGTEPLNIAENGIGSGIINTGDSITDYNEEENILTADQDSLSDILNGAASEDDKKSSLISIFGDKRKPSKTSDKSSISSSDRNNSSSNQSGDSSGGKKPPINKPDNGNNSSGGNSNNNNNNNNSNNNNSDNNNQNTSEIILPTPSYGTETTGTLNQRLVAAYDSESIYMPSVSLDNKTVSYYTKIGDKIYLWKGNLEKADEPKSVGPVTDSKFELKNTTETYSVNTSIFSPDMSMLSMNARGSSNGVWISNLMGSSTLSKLCDEGGGDILAWSPNSSKFVFTNEKGNLFVAYPIEKRIVSVYEGNIKDVAWGSDNKTLVFTNLEDNKQLSLYTVQIP
ncbi:MAG: zf-HC2 domain-containing protein [Bacillota bacterium]